jgi:Fe-S cluster biogenesis protein NfuA
MQPGFHMRAERTPNPNSIKWILGEPILPAGRSAHFEQPVGPEVSPLAARLFAVEGVTGVFVAASFVTVTKREDVEWTDVAQSLVDAIKASRESGEPALGAGFAEAAAGPEDAVVVRIQRILDEEIRPAVAMDGGDIVFAGFRDGIVELYLQGSCHGCPSSTMTLKMGIEQRLMEEIPEVKGVEAI